MAIEYTPLTEERAAFLAQRYVDNIKDKLGDGLQTRSNPTIVLVGGQTGAGKSGLAREAATELSIQGAAVPIDADVMRELLVRKGEKPTPEQTQPDALRLTDLVRYIAMKERYNVIEQGTFARAESLQGWVGDLHQEGYRVEMHAMATPRMVSKISTHTRLEQEYKDGEPNPRWVRPEVHDATYDGFEKTINEVKFDRLKIGTRDMGIVFDSNDIEHSIGGSDGKEALNIGRMLMVEQKARSIEQMDGVIVDATERGVEKSDFYMKSAYATRDEVEAAHAYEPQERETRIEEVREASVGYTAPPIAR